MAGQGGYGSTMVTAAMEPVTDGKFHNLYIVSKALNAGEEGSLILSSIQFKANNGQGHIARRK